MLTACRCPAFDKGDSGSLIYLNSKEGKIALGILKGRRPGDHNAYEAIMLQAAIDDIQHDYRHLIRNLQLLEPGIDF